MASDIRTFEWTISLKDMFSKPMKSVRTEWQKTTEAGSRRSKQLKASIADLSKGFKKFTKDLKDNVTQVKSFSKAIVAGLSLIGVGALAVGLLGALKSLIMVGIEWEEQTMSLVEVTNAWGGSVERLGAQARQLSVYLGEDYEKTVAMVKAMQEVRPEFQKGAGSFAEFSRATVEYATATGQSVESVAGLYAETERLTGKTHGLRRLGDAMKYWADQTNLTNSEMQSIAASTNKLLLMTGKTGDAAVGIQGQLIGVSAIFAQAMGDPQALNQTFTEMHNILADSPLRDFVAGALPGGMSALDEALKAGDYATVFEAMSRAAEAKKDQLAAKGLSFLQIAEHMQAETGMSAEMLQALTNVQSETIMQQLEDEKVRNAANKAAKRRLDTTMRKWNQVKQMFLNVIARLSGPLMKFMKTLIDPLFKFFTGLAEAVDTFVASLAKTEGMDMSFWERMKTAIKAFWEELGGQQYIEDIWSRVTSWLMAHDAGKWLADTLLRPALRATFSKRVSDLLLGPEDFAEPKPDESGLPPHVKDLYHVFGRRLQAEQGSLSPEFERTVLDNYNTFFGQMGRLLAAYDNNLDAIRKLSEAERSKYFDPNQRSAIDTAIEWSLTTDMVEYVTAPASEKERIAAEQQNR